MEIESERILLRGWREEDAPMLYRFASDPDVGPRAGWLAHTTVDESREVIRTVFSNPTTWAIVLKSNGLPIGAMGYGPSCNCGLPALDGEPTGDICTSPTLAIGSDRPIRVLRLRL